ncbi:MAG: carboxypeptidase regulatory-like domain-containing protein [Patescibacteria group bacterium]
MNEKQHSIPQNIMSIQFKLIGNMSMRQFLIIATPLLIGFIMYVVKISNYVTIPFTAIFVLLALAIAFIPIDDRPLDEWITNFIVAIRNPTQRVWKKNEVIPNILKIDRPPVNKTNSKKDVSMFLYQSTFDNSLNSVTEDAVDNALDVKEKTLIANIDKINSMISNGSTSASAPTKNLGTDLFQQGAPMYVGGNSVSSEPQSMQGTPLQNDNLQEMGNVPTSNSSSVQGNNISETSSDSGDTGREESKIPQYNPFNINNITPVSAAEEVRLSGNPNVRDDFVSTNVQTEIPSTGQVDNPFQDIVDQINPQNTSPSKTVSKEEPSVSPEQSVPREGVTQQDATVSTDTAQPLDSSTSSKVQTEPTSEATVTATQSEGGSREEELNKILTRIQSLEEENQRLKAQLTEKPVPTEQAEAKVVEPAPLESQSQNNGFVQTPVQEPVQKEEKHDDTQGNLGQASQDQSLGLTRQQLIDHLPDFTKVPNVVAGVVITDADKILNNAIVIVKDTNQKPVRAVKTNQLGQFFTRTPLPPGRYDIEVDAAGYKFNTATIELSGQIIPPFMFIPIPGEEQKNISGI